MSTDYYEVCDECLSGQRHFHRKGDEPIAHTHWNGKELVLDIYRPPEDGLLNLKYVLDEYGHVSTLGNIQHKTIPRNYRSTGQDIDPQDRIRPTVPNRQSHSDTW